MNNKMYISGAISGINYDIAAANFADAEERVINWQYVPINPLKNGLQKDSHWTEHMMADLAMLLTCGAIYMLEGWEKSDGAKIEHTFAKKMEIPIIYEKRPHTYQHLMG
jgi:hypothetical protein